MSQSSKKDQQNLTSHPAPFPEDSPYSPHENSEIITDFTTFWGVWGGWKDTLVDAGLTPLGGAAFVGNEALAKIFLQHDAEDGAAFGWWWLVRWVGWFHATKLVLPRSTFAEWLMWWKKYAHNKHPHEELVIWHFFQNP